MNRGHLLVISGPSGTGKGTICREIIDRLENIAYSVSMTTRSPRKGEKDGQDYYFVDTDEFMAEAPEGEENAGAEEAEEASVDGADSDDEVKEEEIQ